MEYLVTFLLVVGLVGYLYFKHQEKKKVSGGGDAGPLDPFPRDPQ